MISSFLLLLVASQGESPRVRTVLPNGAIVLVERMAEAKTVSVQLFASSRRVPETFATTGQRHLLEHILAKGPKKNVDLRLESNGCFLVARTHRDAMQFEITCSSGRLDLALETVADLLKPLETSDLEVQRESKILEQEIGLLGDPQRLGMAAWKEAYGDEGLDPVGSADVAAKTTVAELAALKTAHFAPDGLVLCIAGPIDPAEVSTRAGKILSGLKASPAMTPKRRGEGKLGRIEAVGAFGEARAARVGSYKDVRTMAVLAAAFAVASQFEAAFVTYTPTSQNGLVIVGRTDSGSGVGLKIDALKAYEEADLFPLGKMLAKNWVERQMRSASGLASLRGLLLAQSQGALPESMLEAIEQMTLKEFSEGMKQLRIEQAVVSVGVKG